MAVARARPDAGASAAVRRQRDAAAVKQYARLLELRADSKLMLSEGIKEIRAEALARTQIPTQAAAVLRDAAAADLRKIDTVAADRTAQLDAMRLKTRGPPTKKRKAPAAGKKKGGAPSDGKSALQKFEEIMRECEAYTGLKLMQGTGASVGGSGGAAPGTPKAPLTQEQILEEERSDLEQFKLEVDAESDEDDGDAAAAAPATPGGVASEADAESAAAPSPSQATRAAARPDTDAATAPRIPKGTNPAYLGGTLRPYQVDGVNWMLAMHHQCLSGILADEMGLGKTFQTIALLAFLKYTLNVPGPHLVVCPRSVLGNWNREIARFAPGLSVLMFHGDKDARRELRARLKGCTEDIVITTWEQVHMELAAFKKVAFRYIILDEGHKIKNSESMVAQNMRALNGTNRLLLTGTPLQNNLQELWSLLHFLLPGLFDDVGTFEGWFDTEEGTEETRVMDHLHRMLRPFMLRRVKEEANAGIPPKKEVYVSCRLSRMQKHWYQAVLVKDLDQVRESGGSSSSLQNILMHLRKVCDHPYLFAGAQEGPPFYTDEGVVKNSGKMIILDKLLAKVLGAEKKADRQKVLIFSQMTRMLDVLGDYLEWRGYKFCRLDGSTSGEDRDLQMNDFNAPDSDKQVFILSTRAGGLGINLQAASVVVLFDSDWNPQADLQAMDRAHRIGQKRPVTVFRFVVDGTVEERMYQRAMKKLYLDAMVVQQGNLQNRQQTAISKHELKGMIKWGASAVFKGDGDDADIENVDIDAIIRMGAKTVEEQQAEMAKNQQATLDSFTLGVDESNMYQFQGVDYTTHPTKELYIEATGIKGEEFEAAFRSVGPVVQCVMAPTMAMVEYKVVGDAIKAKARFHDSDTERAGTAGRLRVRYGNQGVEITDEMREAVQHRMAAEEAERKRKASAKREVEEAEKELHRKEAEEAVLLTKVQTGVPKFRRLPQHQFFDNDRLEELHDKEHRARLLDKIRNKGRATPPPPQAQTPRDDAASPVPADGDAAAAASGGAGSAGAERAVSPAAPAVPAAAPAVQYLSDGETAEREGLLAQGFPKWSAAHFNAFIRLRAQHGPEELEKVAAGLAGEEGAQIGVEEVRRYSQVFWEKGPSTLEKFPLLKERIDKADSMRAKNAEHMQTVTSKLAEVGKAANVFSPTAPVSKALGLPPLAIDRYLLAYSCVHGGDAEAVASAVRTAPEFHFDMVTKSRTPAQLASRYKRSTTHLLAAASAAAAAAGGGGAAGVGGGAKKRKSSGAKKRRAEEDEDDDDGNETTARRAKKRARKN